MPPSVACFSLAFQTTRNQSRFASYARAGVAQDDVMKRADFLEQAPKAAAMAGFLLGVRPEVLMAQAALESGWGLHTPKTEDGGESFNFFGIKVGAGWT